MKTFVTFGQLHIHLIEGVVVDRDTVFVIEGESAEANRATAFKLFGPRFCMETPEKYWNENYMNKYYHKGYVGAKHKPMSRDELLDIMGSSRSPEEWNANCDKVKEKCGGYPLIWYETIIASGFTNKVFDSYSPTYSHAPLDKEKT